MSLRNINCSGESGIFIYGSEDHVIRDISLENIKMCFGENIKVAM